MKKVIWFRCRVCGKQFSNNEERDEPDSNGYTIRYYFTGGTVLYPLNGKPIATCWECNEKAINEG